MKLNIRLWGWNLIEIGLYIYIYIYIQCIFKNNSQKRILGGKGTFFFCEWVNKKLLNFLMIIKSLQYFKNDTVPVKNSD
jgi:hypothetical protein